MKRIIVLLIAAVAVLLPDAASAQFNLSGVLNSLFGGQKSQTEEQTPNQTVDPYEAIAQAAPSARDILGTWTYDSAEAEYLGTNVLADLAISQVEGYVMQKVESYGITRGSFTILLRRNGTGVITWGSRTLDGRYKYNPETGAITVTGVLNGATLSCSGYVKMEGGKLVALVDANEALAAFKTAYPEYANHQLLQSVSAVAQQFSGIYGAATFTK